MNQTIMFNKPLKNLFIAIPTECSVDAALVPKLIKWSKQGAEVCVVVSSSLIDLARNKCVKAFLASDKKYLLFLDSDTIPEVDGPERLLKTKRDVVAGVYNLLMGRADGNVVVRPSCFKMIYPTRPLEQSVPISTDTGIQHVEMAATGYLLIHRRVFKKIPEPWFEFEWLDKEHTQFHGEDVYFCHKLWENNISIWCDTGAKALHHKTVFI